MKKVGVAEFKARLSHYLKTVKAGRPLVVMDRDTPVARVVPYQSTEGRLIIRHPAPDAPRPGDLRPPRISVKLSVDPVALLLEDRRRR